MHRCRRLLLLATGIFAVIAVAALSVGYAYRDYFFEDRYINQLETGDWMDQVNAARKLGNIKSVKAVPALISALENGAGQESTRTRAFAETEEWLRITVATFVNDRSLNEFVVQGLADHDSMVRASVVLALGRIGPDAKEAIPALTGSLRDQSPFVRASTAEALAKIGAEPDRVVPALVQSLNDKNEVVRKWAAISLGEFGPDAREAVPALAESTEDPDKTVRRTAAEALKQIQRHEPPPR